jgi:hypothetical protein
VPNARRRVSQFFCVEAAKTRVGFCRKSSLYDLFSIGLGSTKLVLLE